MEIINFGLRETGARPLHPSFDPPLCTSVYFNMSVCCFHEEMKCLDHLSSRLLK